MTDIWTYGFLAGVAVVVLVNGRKLFARERRDRDTFVRNVREGGAEPVSLHPSLDPNRCISIGTCATACPEGEIIGLVNGRAELIVPNKCIGHGACAAACPVEAIAKHRSKDPAILDVVVVGAGPAGLSATLQAQKDGLRCTTVDQMGVGGMLPEKPLTTAGPWAML